MGWRRGGFGELKRKCLVCCNFSMNNAGVRFNTFGRRLRQITARQVPARARSCTLLISSVTNLVTGCSTRFNIRNGINLNVPKVRSTRANTLLADGIPTTGNRFLHGSLRTGVNHSMGVSGSTGYFTLSRT